MRSLLLTLLAVTCLTATEGTLPQPPPPDEKHAYGFDVIPGVGVYKFHAEPRDWKSAWRECSEEDSHLAVIESREEAEQLKLYIRRKHPMRHRPILVTEHTFFISMGFHSLYSDRFWTTLFGEPLDQYYSEWGSGRPATFGSEALCGAVNLRMELVDIPCEGKGYSFLCEKYLPETWYGQTSPPPPAPVHGETW